MQCDLGFGIWDLGFVERSSGAVLAERIFARFQTRDVFQIAEKAGVKIRFEKWFPATAGEFDWKNKTIIVNENAPVSMEKIVAHELGHFFIREFEIENIIDEEKFCDEFAENLLRSGLKTQANRTKAFSLNADRADQADFHDCFFRNNPFDLPNPPNPRSKKYFFEFSNGF
jgi:hypothetical protein